MSMVPQTGIMQLLSKMPQKYPFAFQLPIASIKTWAADYLVQTQVERREEIDVNRSLTFAAFGLLYSGGFQYAVFVKGFTRWFPKAAPFTKLPLRNKMADKAGLKALLGQIAAHSAVSTCAYLPMYYCLKEFVSERDKPREDQASPTQVVRAALTKYRTNFIADNLAIQGFWIPADVLIFGLCPMWARMPVQHTTSLGWTMILSSLRGSSDQHVDPKSFTKASDQIQRSPTLWERAEPWRHRDGIHHRGSTLSVFCANPLF